MAATLSQPLLESYLGYQILGNEGTLHIALLILGADLLVVRSQ